MTYKSNRPDEMDRSLSEYAGRIAAPLRDPVALRAELGDRIMAEVFEETGRAAPVASGPPSVPAGSRGWLLQPRTFRVAPLPLLAMAASILFAVVTATSAIARQSARSVETEFPAGPAVANAPAETVHIVRFQLAAPGARTVSLAGDFNGWSRDAIILRPGERKGVWTTTLRLKPGRHEYAFIVDGKRWVADPYATTRTDEFNVQSSVVSIGETTVE